MRGNVRLARVLLALLAVVLLGAGCGGGSDDASSNDSADDAADTAAPDDSAKDTDADDSSSSSSSDDSSDDDQGGAMPKIADGTFKKGTATVEVSDEEEKTFDALTVGQTEDGTTLLSFMAADSNLTIGFGPNDGDNSVSVAVPGVSVGGTFGEQCGVQFSKNDATGLAGEFTCTDAPATDSSTGKLGERDLKGTFSVER